MKTVIICPNQAPGIPVLADTKPVVTLPVLGEPFICHWLQHLASEKYNEVRIVTSDSPELVEECTGDGRRWGLNVEILHEVRELKLEEARKRYRPADEPGWAPAPLDVIEADHLPGLGAEKLFSSYQKWFETMDSWLPSLTSQRRIGLRELEPGVWVGRRTRIGANAKLKGPCWIGDHVRIGKNAVIGPLAFLEDRVAAESNCEIVQSWVGPDTYVGSLTHLNESLAWGNLLISWKTGSHIFVPDSFLMASLVGENRSEERTAHAPAPVVSNPLARPFGSVISLAQKLQG